MARPRVKQVGMGPNTTFIRVVDTTQHMLIDRTAYEKRCKRRFFVVV